MRQSTRVGTQSELLLEPRPTSTAALSFSSWEKRKSAGGTSPRAFWVRATAPFRSNCQNSAAKLARLIKTPPPLHREQVAQLRAALSNV